MKKAIFPGSFDPFHEGHKSIYEKAQMLFDEVYIYLTNNDTKIHHEDLDKRKSKIKELLPKAKVIIDKKLTTIKAKELECMYIVRGLRTIDEVEYEHFMASVNKKLSTHMETILIFADQELQGVSSTFIRELKNKYTKAK